MKVSMLLEFHVIINAGMTAEAVNNPKDIRTTTSVSWHLSSQARVARCTIYHWTRSIEFLCFRFSCFNQVFPSLNFMKKDQDFIQADCSRKIKMLWIMVKMKILMLSWQKSVGSFNFYEVSPFHWRYKRRNKKKQNKSKIIDKNNSLCPQNKLYET